MVYNGSAPRVFHERAALLPGAVSWCIAPRRLVTDTVRIGLDFTTDTVSITGQADGDLRDFRTRLPEREAFEERELRHERDLLEPKDRGVANYHSIVEANTLISGMVDAVTPGRPRPFTKAGLALAGLVSGLGGHAFQGDISGPAKGGADSLAWQYPDMARYGIQLHDHPWRPAATLRGRVLEACLAAGDPDRLDLGRRLGPILAHREARIVDTALMVAIEALGQDPVQFSAANRHIAPSAHDRAAAAGLLGDLARETGATIPTITP